MGQDRSPPVSPHGYVGVPKPNNMEDKIMQQLIPEHPASYAADAIVLAFILLTIYFMILVW